jgi:hypothetical protein
MGPFSIQSAKPSWGKETSSYMPWPAISETDEESVWSESAPSGVSSRWIGTQKNSSSQHRSQGQMDTEQRGSIRG